MKVDSAQLKKDGISALLVTGGFVGANAVNQLIPIENPIIKSAIPLAAGLVGIAFGGENDMIKDAAKGMAAYGVLAIVRAAVTSGPDTLKKMVTSGSYGEKAFNLLIPNLGTIEDEYSTVVEPWDMADEFDEFDEEEDYTMEGVEEPLFLDGAEAPLFPELGNASYDEHQNDPYVGSSTMYNY